MSLFYLKEISDSSDQPPDHRSSQPLAPRNDLLDSGDWLKDVIWDATKVSADLIEDEDEEPIDKSKLPNAPIPKLDPFDISNDHLYEHSREARFRIRQTFGAIEVFHSYPAKKLQIPFVSGLLWRGKGWQGTHS